MPYKSTLGTDRIPCSICAELADMTDLEDGELYCGCCYSDRNPACYSCGSETDVNIDQLLCVNCIAKGIR